MEFIYCSYSHSFFSMLHTQFLLVLTIGLTRDTVIPLGLLKL